MSIRSIDFLSAHVFSQISEIVAQHQSKKIIIGFSGGLDSSVLVHLLSHVKSSFDNTQIQAVHVNHGIHENADDWQAFCESTCQNYHIDVNAYHFCLDEIKTNREAVYREYRYLAFTKSMSDNDVLLTAHHQYDQAETILMNLFRGAGMAGLSGMSPLRKLENGFHLRPLLNVPQSTILKYAQFHQLEWMNDESNQDIEFNRNFIRHELLPVISTRWPQVQKSISRCGDIVSESEQVLHEIAMQDMIESTSNNYPGVIEGAYLSVLEISKLTKYSQPRIKNLIKHWSIQHCDMILSSTHIDQIVVDLISKPTENGLFELNNFQIRVFQGYLYLMQTFQKPDDNNLESVQNDRLVSFKDFSFSVEIKANNYENFNYRFRKGGESLLLNGQTKSLKNVLNEKNIPTWERQLIPLIFSDNELIIVPGVICADNVAIDKGLIKFNSV